jgi:hypothetical protein
MMAKMLLPGFTWSASLFSFMISLTVAYLALLTRLIVSFFVRKCLNMSFCELNSSKVH